MNIMRYLNCLLLLTGLANVLYAQSDRIIPADQFPAHPLSDQATGLSLQKDWSNRNSKIQNLPVQWYEIGDGYYGTYSVDNQNYMTVYDIEGHYIETLRRLEWNGNDQNPVKSSFDLSTYRTQEVTSYWEVVDRNQKGYYLEVTDDQGKVSRLWANEKGDLSSSIPKAKSKY
ncbi:MAG: hypothetical protein ABI663_15265 [Chryseolinea sp.]